MLLALLVGAGVLLALPGHGGPAARLADPTEAGSGKAPRPPLVEDRGRRLLVCMGAGAVLGWGLVGSLGVPIGAALGAVGSEWLGRLEPPSAVRRREQVRRDLPLFVELLAACAEVGLPPERALRVVSAAVGGPLGDRLGAVAARLALGVDPVLEWRTVASDPHLAPLARTMLRTLESGAPLASGMGRLARDRRRDLRTAGQVRARRVGVQAAGPLGLCFLPAFMLIGVVPTVVSTFSTVVLS